MCRANSSRRAQEDLLVSGTNYCFFYWKIVAGIARLSMVVCKQICYGPSCHYYRKGCHFDLKGRRVGRQTSGHCGGHGCEAQPSSDLHASRTPDSSCNRTSEQPLGLSNASMQLPKASHSNLRTETLSSSCRSLVTPFINANG